jgi:hypothetical protein
MGKVRLLLLITLVATVTVSLCFAAERNFRGKLSGNQEVPGIKTKATGEAEFKLIKDGKKLSYKLTVNNIKNVTAAHIHEGKKGKVGPHVVGLFAGPKKEGKFNGVLAEGTITENDLMGDLQGKPLEALIKLMKSGNVYINVHTDTHPDGEIRGQIGYTSQDFKAHPLAP